MKHVTLQKIVAHDFRYDPRIVCTPYCNTMYVYIVKTATFPILNNICIVYFSISL